MKSILEYNKNKIEIEVPKWVVDYSKWLNDNCDEKVLETLFNDAYDELSAWYQNKANKLFNKSDLFMGGFYIQSKEMENNNIVDYCKFIEL